MQKDVKVPIDITKSEYEKLKENLELFNEGVCDEDRLTFDEFVSLVFETSSLDERLDSKYNHLNALKAEIRQLEDELDVKYSIGLTDSQENYSEVLKLRKKVLKESSSYINGPHF